MEGYEISKKILADNLDVLHRISQALLDFETIDGHEVELLCQGGSLGACGKGSASATSEGSNEITMWTHNAGNPEELAAIQGIVDSYNAGSDAKASGVTYDVKAVGDVTIDRLFDATIEATEEAIVNALIAAETVVGRDGITAYAIPHDRVRELLAAAGR